MGRSGRAGLGMDSPSLWDKVTLEEHIGKKFQDMVKWFHVWFR